MENFIFCAVGENLACKTTPRWKKIEFFHFPDAYYIIYPSENVG